MWGVRAACSVGVRVGHFVRPSMRSSALADDHPKTPAHFQHHLSSHSSSARAAIDKRFAQRSYCTLVAAHRAQLRAIPSTSTLDKYATARAIISTGALRCVNPSSVGRGKYCTAVRLYSESVYTPYPRSLACGRDARPSDGARTGRLMPGTQPKFLQCSSRRADGRPACCEHRC